MAVYAIGDIQGCFDELQTLLNKLHFDPVRDRLLFAGDLVNRGPKSLKTLRFVKNLGASALTVLGNHDLNLLAIAYGKRRLKPSDTLLEILKAHDRDELLYWLRQQPLMHHDDIFNFTLIHAGLPPQWDLADAQRLAGEVETLLRGDGFAEFLTQMYGDQPDTWSESLTGSERYRFITNCFTRMRFCTSQGQIDLKYKGAPGSQPAPLRPWFSIENRRSRNLNIVFGHWSTLGATEATGICCLDSGCVWGGALTAIRLDSDDMTRTSVACIGEYTSPA